jgi:DNA-binding GntR family transcriptional regulator
VLSQTAQQRKATAAASKSLNPAEVEELARNVFAEIAPKARDNGVDLYQRENELILRLIGELSGLGQLLELIAAGDVEDITPIEQQKDGNTWDLHRPISPVAFGY